MAEVSFGGGVLSLLVIAIYITLIPYCGQQKDLHDMVFTNQCPQSTIAKYVTAKLFFGPKYVSERKYRLSCLDYEIPTETKGGIQSQEVLLIQVTCQVFTLFLDEETISHYI